MTKRKPYYQFTFGADAETIEQIMSHFQMAIEQLKLLSEKAIIPDTNGRGETETSSYFYELKDVSAEKDMS